MLAILISELSYDRIVGNYLFNVTYIHQTQDLMNESITFLYIIAIQNVGFLVSKVRLELTTSAL